MEMSEEDATLFWRVDTPTDPVSGEESADPILDSREATPARRLCLGPTTVPKQARATKAPAVDCGTNRATPAEAAQDTKPAVQSPATNTADVDEIQGDEIAIPILRHVTTGTQKTKIAYRMQRL